MNESDRPHFEKLLKLLEQVDAWIQRIDPDGPRLSIEDGSALHGDNKRTHPYQTGFYAWNSLTHAVDHLHLLRSVLRDAAAIHLFAPYSVIRGALENASTAAWLLAPAQRPVRIERLLRLAAVDMRAGEKAKKLIGSTGPRTEQERLDDLRKIAAAVGIAEAAALKHVSFSEIVRTAGAETGVPQVDQVNEFVWRLCSGNAHGDMWTTISGTERAEMPGAPAGIANLAIEASVPSLHNATLVAYRMTKRGWDLFDERRRAPY